MRAEAEAGHPDVRRLGKQLPGVVILQQRVHCAHALLDALQRVRGELLQPGDGELALKVPREARQALH